MKAMILIHRGKHPRFSKLGCLPLGAYYVAGDERGGKEGGAGRLTKVLLKITGAWRRRRGDFRRETLPTLASDDSWHFVLGRGTIKILEFRADRTCVL